MRTSSECVTEVDVVVQLANKKDEDRQVRKRRRGSYRRLEILEKSKWSGNRRTREKGKERSGSVGIIKGEARRAGDD